MITDIEEKKGTYAAVKFSQQTIDDLSAFIKHFQIRNSIAPEDLHTTLLYSRKYLPDFRAQGVLVRPIEGYNLSLDVWQKDGSEKRVLVIEYTCPELVYRHDTLMFRHGATYDFMFYRPHTTLSYNFIEDDLKLAEMKRDLGNFISSIEIVSEYSEELDTD